MLVTFYVRIISFRLRLDSRLRVGNEGLQDTFNLKRSPDALNLERSPDVINLERSPDTFNLERSPDVINLERSPDTFNLERSPHTFSLESPCPGSSPTAGSHPGSAKSIVL